MTRGNKQFLALNEISIQAKTNLVGSGTNTDLVGNKLKGTERSGSAGSSGETWGVHRFSSERAGAAQGSIREAQVGIGEAQGSIGEAQGSIGDAQGSTGEAQGSRGAGQGSTVQHKEVQYNTMEYSATQGSTVKHKGVSTREQRGDTREYRATQGSIGRGTTREYRATEESVCQHKGVYANTREYMPPQGSIGATKG